MSGRAARIVVSLFLGGMALAVERPGVRLDVPFVKQERDGCGAASIAMVMKYWQGPATPNASEIQRAIYSRQAHGIYASSLERYLQQHGFRTFSFRAEWADLRHHLTKGRPLIVALKPGRSDLHYVVVTGMDWQQELVLKHDPATRQLVQQHRSDFEKEWSGAGNWTLLAVPAHESPSP